MMFVSFRSKTTDATSRGGTGASTFTFVFLLPFPRLIMGMPPINQPLTYYDLAPFLARFQLYPGIDLLLEEENRVP